MSKTTAKNSEGKGKRFGKNLLILLVSFVISLALWYMCTVQDERIISKKFSDIPVIFTNEAMLAENDFATKELEKNTVSVVLKGTVSNLNDIDAKDLFAVVDLGNVADTGKYLSSPTVTGIPENVTAKADPVEIEIEKVITKYLSIDVEIVGTPADGFKVSKENIVLVDSEPVGISCGASVSMNVASAKVVVDVNNRNSNYNVNLNIILLNARGEIIDMNKVKLARDSVNVSVTVVEE